MELRETLPNATIGTCSTTELSQQMALFLLWNKKSILPCSTDILTVKYSSVSVIGSPFWEERFILKMGNYN